MFEMMKRKIFAPLLTGVMAVGLFAGCGAAQTKEAGSTNAGDSKPTAQAAEQVVNIYSARTYDVDTLLYKKFTEETGIKVNVIDGKAEELIERLKREGESTQADLFLTVDGGVLNTAKQAGLLQPVTSETIDQNVPKELRDPENQWIGLSTRARVIVYSRIV